MKNSRIVTLSLLILSGAGLAMADEAMLGNKTLVKPEVLTDQTRVNADTNMGNDKVDVNEADSVEVNKSAMRENEAKISETRKDIGRDSQKLTEDTAKLSAAQSKNAADEVAKAKSDVENDKSAVHQDSERLKARLADKIENDKSTIRKYDEKIRDGQEEMARDTQKTTDDTAKLADAQSRNAADEVAKAKSDVENDKDAATEDSAMMEKRAADKAECVAELKRDRRHLDEVVKHLSEDGQASANVNGDAEVGDQASASK